MTKHKAKGLLITCIDYRFIDAFYNETGELGIEHSYDRVAIAGDIKNLVKPDDPGLAEVVMRQIEISKRLHDIEEVIIISHQDCGAYPELQGLPEEEEIRVHYQDLRDAKKMIQERVPDVLVMLYFATIKEEKENNIIGFEKVD